MDARLDIVLPVYSEGGNILRTLLALKRSVTTPYRVLICYDFDGDDTLAAIKEHAQECSGIEIGFVRNRARGVHDAIMSGFEASTAPFVLMYPADDDYNAGLLDRMVEEGQRGADIVCASRFIPGGEMTGCPWLKAVLVRCASFTLHHFARLPARDSTNGFRLFSRRVIEQIPVESEAGFCYSVELLVKCHRLGWPIAEVPAAWHERREGQSRFRVLKWLPAYLRWYRYAFATTWLRRSPESVALRPAAGVAET
ncbi:MAG TPA: glycosyltransferase family 2 protein [Candidatus Binataceae bacterium]|nr:glycosyltransferase family 2 protein [Candidatus Binataceae bacterium]